MEVEVEIDLWRKLDYLEVTFREDVLAMVYMDGVEWERWKDEVDKRRVQERQLTFKISELRTHVNNQVRLDAERASAGESWWTHIFGSYLCLSLGDTAESAAEHGVDGDRHQDPNYLVNQRKKIEEITKLTRELASIEEERKQFQHARQERRTQWTEAQARVLQRLEPPMEDTLAPDLHPRLRVQMPLEQASAMVGTLDVLGKLDEFAVETVVALGILYARLLHCFDEAKVTPVWRSYPFAYHNQKESHHETMNIDMNVQTYMEGWFSRTSGQEAQRIAGSGSGAFIDVDVLCAQAGSCKQNAVLSEYTLTIAQNAIVTVTELLGMPDELAHGLVAHLRRSIITQAKSLLRTEYGDQSKATYLPRRPDYLCFYPLIIVALRMIRQWYYLVKQAEYEVDLSNDSTEGPAVEDKYGQHAIQRKAIHKLGKVMQLKNVFALKALVHVAQSNADWANRALAGDILVQALEELPDYVDVIVQVLAAKIASPREHYKVKEAIQDSIVEAFAQESLGKMARKRLHSAISKACEKDPNTDGKAVATLLEKSGEGLRRARVESTHRINSDKLLAKNLPPFPTSMPQTVAGRHKAGMTLRELRERYKTEA